MCRAFHGRQTAHTGLQQTTSNGAGIGRIDLESLGHRIRSDRYDSPFHGDRGRVL